MAGLNNGRWVPTSSPNNIDYPFAIASKLIRDSKSCTHEEVCELVSITRDFYDLCKEQDATIRQLEKELKISESTVKLLQVDAT